jgi:hypothetical protein
MYADEVGASQAYVLESSAAPGKLTHCTRKPKLPWTHELRCPPHWPGILTARSRPLCGLDANWIRATLRVGRPPSLSQGIYMANSSTTAIQLVLVLIQRICGLIQSSTAHYKPNSGRSAKLVSDVGRSKAARRPTV